MSNSARNRIMSLRTPTSREWPDARLEAPLIEQQNVFAAQYCAIDEQLLSTRSIATIIDRSKSDD